MLLLHVANKASMSTTRTVSTTVAVSENGAYNGCQWKRVSSCVRKWRNVLMASLLCESIPVDCLYFANIPTVDIHNQSFTYGPIVL